ncbi:MAG TPA: antitoxin Xre-like helix-turn-helix domain-containing protein [Flavisolibacter sp.]|jgi:putative toxin-antitoxin system antitoxin component (TIGR02293 family)|nr:antitoxin Xre-like helix-turn-helix domain-containing protein [Flavisolibacter sp.]
MAIGLTITGNSIFNRFKSLGLNNPYKLVSTARKGVKPKLFYEFAGIINMSEKSLAAIINLSARTLSNYQEQQKNLEPVYSEHLLKLISLYEKGETIFGNIDEFNYWLKKPLWNAKESPLDWLVTPGGVDLLMKELEKLAEGYPV